MQKYPSRREIDFSAFEKDDNLGARYGLPTNV
mgnify:CR=1 FL=1